MNYNEFYKKALLKEFLEEQANLHWMVQKPEIILSKMKMDTTMV
jgi:hypothetical protein